MKATLKDSRIWLLANILGVCVYLLLESWILAPRSEAESLNGIDVGYFWLTRECPILVVFLLLNLTWLSLIIKRGRSSKNWHPLVIWVLVCLMWGAAFLTYGVGIGILKIIVDMIDGRAWK